jgi:hypothetical protein
METKPKRTRRTKAEMDAIRNASIAVKAPISALEDVNFNFEGDSEGEELTEAGKAYFFIENGNETLRVKAFKDYWAIQKMTVNTDKDTGKETANWVGFKFVTDLGSVANRIFDMRLKNSDTKTLKELSDAAKRIGEEIRKEFKCKKEMVK